MVKLNSHYNWTGKQLSKVKIDHFKVGDCDIKPSTLLRNLGAWFNEKFTSVTHFTERISDFGFLSSSYYIVYINVLFMLKYFNLVVQ